MALLSPFRGYRFNPKIAGDLALVVTQPYDKISPALQSEYYGRSPWNVVRLTRSLEKSDNPESDYPEAARTLQSWMDDGVLLQETFPCIYAYCQQYELDGQSMVRTGFVALLDLRHSAAGILPHERTLAELRMDRLRLLRGIECNEDMVFMIYTEDKLKVNGLLGETTSKRPPEIMIEDDHGAVHCLWAIRDPKSIRKVQDAMVPEELFIADGHHRFEAALDYKRDCEARGWKPAAVESFHHRMVACFNSADGEITILPTHRLVRDIPDFDPRRLLAAAGKYFDVELCPDAGNLWEKMTAGQGGSHVFGLYSPKQFALLRLRKESLVDPLMLAHAEAYRHLDVSILHAAILNRLLGLGEGDISAGVHVDFERDRAACVRRVDEGAVQAAFFLNPTTVEQLQRVALLGERMPMKSTDIYPKLLTGLVFMKMQIARP
jgi:uncharacterized protein (DUF1015 family)